MVKLINLNPKQILILNIKTNDIFIKSLQIRLSPKQNPKFTINLINDDIRWQICCKIH